MRSYNLFLVVVCLLIGYWVIPLFSKNTQDAMTIRMKRAETAIKKLQNDLNASNTELSQKRRTNYQVLNDKINNLSSNVLNILPNGTILPYHGKSTDRLPDGWVFCDGKRNGIPNLQGYFLRGAESTKSGTTGGLDESLSHHHELGNHEHEMDHSHTLKIRDSIEDHDGMIDYAGGDGEIIYIHGGKVNSTSLSHSHFGSTSYLGAFSKETGYSGEGTTYNDGAHDNRPKFFEVHYIMKIN